MYQLASVRAARILTAPVVHASFLRPCVVKETSQMRSSVVVHRLLNSQPDWSAPKVTYEELKPLTEQPSDRVVLIDVREPDEIAQGNIPSSVPLPLSGIRLALQMNAEKFEKTYGFKKPGDGKQDVIFYCRSGKRSATACDEAMKQGWKNVKNYEGSWLDWTKREAEGKSQ